MLRQKYFWAWYNSNPTCSSLCWSPYDYSLFTISTLLYMLDQEFSEEILLTVRKWWFYITIFSYFDSCFDCFYEPSFKLCVFFWVQIPGTTQFFIFYKIWLRYRVDDKFVVKVTKKEISFIIRYKPSGTSGTRSLPGTPRLLKRCTAC